MKSEILTLGRYRIHLNKDSITITNVVNGDIVFDTPKNSISIGYDNNKIIVSETDDQIFSNLRIIADYVVGIEGGLFGIKHINKGPIKSVSLTDGSVIVNKHPNGEFGVQQILSV